MGGNFNNKPMSFEDMEESVEGVVGSEKSEQPTDKEKEEQE